MSQRKKIGGFSLVELLVTISILATISIVAYVSYSGHLRTSYNSTRIETIDSLYLSLSDYMLLKKTLPAANSNYISYDEQGTYMHSVSGAYGISGYVSNNFLPAGYVNFQATDPESKQFYGYGKLTDDTAFDLAAALYDDITGTYKTYLRGTYSKDHLASLIRSYSSSNFVSQNSIEDLPYNPYERKVSAFISSYSGVVAVINSAGNTLSLTGELNSGDNIIVATGSTVLLHISDGSELSLGSTTNETRLALSTLVYNDDNNLASKVSLLLSLGEVWVEAPHLRTETDSVSDFSIQTDSALAAVRGTVFGVSKNTLGVTQLALASGKLEVAKITTSTTGVILSQYPFINGFSTTASTGFVFQSSTGPSLKSLMIVGDGEQPIILNGIQNEIPSVTSTGFLSPDIIKTKIRRPSFSLGFRPRANKISFSTGAVDPEASTSNGILSVTFKNPGATSYYLSFGTGTIDPSQPFPIQDPNPFYTGALSSTGGIVTLTGVFAYSVNIQKRTYTLRICMDKKCSAPDIKVLGGDMFAFDNFREWGKHQTDCPANPAEAKFWTKDCLIGENEGLVAYAPYDDFFHTDVNLYGAHGILDRGITANLIDHSQSVDYKLSTNTFFSSGTQGSKRYLSGSIYLGESLTGSNNKYSFYNWKDTGTNKIITGILPDSYGVGDYLKYNTIPLHLTGSFSIEMSVRGAALKRTTGIYHLFNANSGRLYLRVNSGSLDFGYFSSGITLPMNSYSGLLQDNIFYTIKTSASNNYGTLQILDQNRQQIAFTGGSIQDISLRTPPIYTDPLYIGSTSIGSTSASSPLYQWNDIIDSVKIYNQ